MDISPDQSIGLVGCGFMGKALLEGWLAKGISARALHVHDPRPSGWLQSQAGININAPFPDDISAIVIATRPPAVDQVLPGLRAYGGGPAVFVSIAASRPISVFEAQLGAATPIVRAMPNLPATVGAAVTTLVANESVGPGHKVLVTKLLSAIGSVVELPGEDLFPVVTAMSGAGPAYVFAMAEAFADAGAELGLPEELAHELAIKTVAGAGRMLGQADADATGFRVAVTSKGGTTEAGMLEFMSDEHGIQDLAKRTIMAATARCRELSGLVSEEAPKPLDPVED